MLKIASQRNHIPAPFQIACVESRGAHGAFPPSENITPRSSLPHMSILRPRCSRTLFPHLVQAQAAALAVGSVAIDDDEPDLRGEGFKIVVGEQMDVPQTVTAVTPVQQIITWFNIGVGQTDVAPRENAFHQARARSEIPG